MISSKIHLSFPKTSLCYTKLLNSLSPHYDFWLLYFVSGFFQVFFCKQPLRSLGSYMELVVLVNKGQASAAVSYVYVISGNKKKKTE